MYVLGNDTKEDHSVFTGTLFLNNRYASKLFYADANRNFVSIMFMPLLENPSTPVGIRYDVELANGSVERVTSIVLGCTMNTLNHPFNIDLLPVTLGSFDVIIGMKWLLEHKANIICDKKILHVLYGREVQNI